MRRAALLAAVCALALPAGAGAMEMDHGDGGAMLSIGFAAFAPVTANVLAGDTVMWSNNSTRAHTVTADDGSFDSGRLVGGADFHMRFDQVGAVPYYCRLHSFMRGEVDVHRLLLDVPRDTTTGPGRPFVFTGRSALAPGTDVRIEADSGGGFSPVGSTTVADDGTFKATVSPDASAAFRAVAGDDASQPVSLLVRFGWWPVARATVGRDGRATLATPVGRRVPARVVLTLSDGATQLARTRAFSVGR